MGCVACNKSKVGNKVAKLSQVNWLVTLTNGTEQEFGSASLAHNFARKHPGAQAHRVLKNNSEKSETKKATKASSSKKKVVK